MKTYESLQYDIDQDKIKKLQASMEANGWQGCPILVFGETIIDGNHRAKAAELTETEIEVITLEELVEEAGFDFTTFHKKYGCPCADFAGFDVIEKMLEELPLNIIAKYNLLVS